LTAAAPFGESRIQPALDAGEPAGRLAAGSVEARRESKAVAVCAMQRNRVALLLGSGGKSR
jgi:hypothetical protein